MKLLLLTSIMCMVLYSNTYAKEYTYQTKVSSLYTQEVIQSIFVVCVTEQGDTIGSTYTDEKGIAKIEQLKAKKFDVFFSDSTNYYKPKHIQVELIGTHSIDETVFLRFGSEQEQIMISARRNYQRELESDTTEQLKISNQIPDVEASFPGGNVAMHKYIINTVEYPEESLEMGEQGRVYVSFIIERDGTLTNIEVKRGVSKAIDREAKMIFYYMPKWTPAEIEGEKVRTKAILPINFRLT